MPVFISYSQKDEATYNRLCSDLKQNKIESWDTKSMRLAASLRDQLREAINECDTCVYLATRNSVLSKWCSAEIGAFWGAGKKVIVFVADPDLTDDQIPPQFQGDLWTSDVREVVRTIESSMLPVPKHSPAPLFFFSYEGSTSRDKAKIEIIRRVVMQAGDGKGGNESSAFHEIENLQNLDDETIRLWKGLFLGMPYKQEFSKSLITRLVKWVRAGGNLVITCFELGERHHETNVNQLAYHFGIYFNSDVVVAPSPHEDQHNKDYGVTLLYSQINKESNPPLFQGVSKIAMKNACSLHLEPGAVSLVLAAPNQIRELQEGDYSSAHALAVGDQRFGRPYEDPSRAVIALAPEGLTGSGRVLATGTWDFRGDERQNDNDGFLRNLLHWLTS
jgi:TIR domain